MTKIEWSSYMHCAVRNGKNKGENNVKIWSTPEVSLCQNLLILEVLYVATTEVKEYLSQIISKIS